MFLSPRDGMDLHAFSGRIEADSAPFGRSIIIQAPREYFIQLLAQDVPFGYDDVYVAFALVFFHASRTATAFV